MQFVLTAYDGKDQEALERRLSARKEHIELGDKLVASGNMLYGVAILDDEGKMIGSVVILDFPSRKELESWLAIEPYVVSNVWQDVEIKPCKVGPSYTKLHF